MTLTDSFREPRVIKFSRIPPKRKVPPVSVVVDCRGSDQTEISSIVKDLLASTFHDLRVYFTNCKDFGYEIEEQLREDDRFLLSNSWPGFDDGSNIVIYVPAGFRLIRYSIEAMVEALGVRSVNVLRILASKSSTGIEVWRTEFVRNTGSVQAAERIARNSRTEWWVNADSVGVWAEGGSLPKPFVRRGTAGEHVLVVRVYDARSDAVNRRHEEDAEQLRREIRRLRHALSLRDSGVAARSGRLRAQHSMSRAWVKKVVMKLRTL